MRIGKIQMNTELKRTKVTHRLSKHRIKSNRKVEKNYGSNRQLHRSKIKNKRKFQINDVDNGDDDNQRTEMEMEMHEFNNNMGILPTV